MLEELKAEVLAAAREAESEGLCRQKSGNFSRIDESRQYIAITPSGLNRQALTPDDIIIINKELHIVENLHGRNPSSESLMHVAAYEARPDAVAVAHTHSSHALAFAIIEKPVPAVLVESAHLNLQRGHIPVARYGRQGSQELADSVRDPLAESDATILARHGVLAISTISASDAVLKAIYVEDLCAAYFRALLLADCSEPRRYIHRIPQADLIRQSPNFG